MIRSPERGSAMLVTLIIITALMAGAATLTQMQLTSTRSSSLVRDKMASLHCAEAGLAVARAAVTANVTSWNSALAMTTEPSWLQSLPHDIDGDGVRDFTLRLRDNADETVDNPNVDNDLAVFVVSSCVKFTDAPAEVMELVRFNGGGSCYQAQLGGCGGNSNAN
ncbi:MAG TPA: pilus assembly PilX N-terminal domain-containing protein [Kofleriaceae bacterium]|nr:pilus assembly PilX N-terminal domain-containing protein [Kofleriaceae bacterium]